MKVLITGGAGFIGSHFVKWLHQYDKSIVITNLDALTYSGNLQNLKELESSNRHHFIKGNICDSNLVEKLVSETEMVINFAAETHVDKSISDPKDFIQTNILGSFTLLESMRKQAKIIRFIQVSTDEVYGASEDTGSFSEDSPILPNNPYAASKASADLLIRSYHHTYDLNTVVTRCSNNYGPNQYTEKLIPLMITKASKSESLPLYGDGKQIRDWIHTVDYCEGIWLAATKGKSGEIYNFGSNTELQNIEVVKKILKILNKPESLIQFVKDRPGHDRRYSMDTLKARTELGWKSKINFNDGLKSTIDWYLKK